MKFIEILSYLRFYYNFFNVHFQISQSSDLIQEKTLNLLLFFIQLSWDVLSI